MAHACEKAIFGGVGLLQFAHCRGEPGGLLLNLPFQRVAPQQNDDHGEGEGEYTAGKRPDNGPCEGLKLVIHAEPPLVYFVVLPGGLQEVEPLVEDREELSVSLLHRKGIGTLHEGLRENTNIAVPFLPEKPHPLNHSHYQAVGGALLQGRNQCFPFTHGDNLSSDPVLDEVVMPEVARLHQDPPVSDVVDAPYIGVFRHEHPEGGDEVGDGEVDPPVPFRRLVHSRKHIDLAGLELTSDLLPWPEADAHIEIHDLGDPCEDIYIESGRLTRVVEKLERRVVPVAARCDRSLRGTGLLAG